MTALERKEFSMLIEFNWNIQRSWLQRKHFQTGEKLGMERDREALKKTDKVNREEQGLEMKKTFLI